MPLQVIYIVRHAHRLHWTVDPISGRYTSNAPTPTGIPADAQLASYGVAQAKELADEVTKLRPGPDVIYSSPWYRCLQTIKPSVLRLQTQSGFDGKVRVENGIGEFFGTAHFRHPAPADLSKLGEHFDFIDPSYQTHVKPLQNGETLQGLHDRLAHALHRIIQDADNDPRQPYAALLCTHAAGMICAARALTGRMPDDPTEEDFRCGTCALSRFERRSSSSTSKTIGPRSEAQPRAVPQLDWRDGRGVAGGWHCVLNGDCSFLKGGEERTWRFTGDESFIHDPQPQGYGKL